MLQDRLRLLARVLHEREVGREVRDVQRGQAVLPPAEKVARPALGEVGARDLKAVAGLAQDLEPLAGGFALVRAEKDAVGLPRAAPDAPA